MRCKNYTKQKGMSMVEVIVVTGIVAVFFSSLLSSFYFTVSLVQDSRVRQTALSVANNQIEYIRSLSYNAVGTVAGIPAGAIPQVATTTLNDIPFTVTTLVEYVDDPADGEGSEDENGITTDYKNAKVTVSWQWRGQERELFLLSRVIPRSIETDVGGGTIRVNVFDADVQPLPGASVQLINTSLTPAINVTRETNAQGVALFGGAPAGAGYEVLVTSDGYSTDGTNPITAQLINPATPPATVAEADITTLNFFIDAVSTLAIQTVSPAVYEDWIESFATSTSVANGSGVAVDGGILRLEGGVGTYIASGNAQLQSIAPASLSGWGVVTITGDTPSSTNRMVQVYSGAVTPVLIPDSELPGNSAGFFGDSIVLSSLDPLVYPALRLGVTLTTSNQNNTPTLDEVKVSYVAVLSPLANVPLVIRGDKVIGTRGDGTSVYKFMRTLSTDSAGDLVLEDIEWDAYSVTPNGYTVAEACTENPVIVAPATATSLRLTLVPSVANALRAVVTTADGAIASAVEVELSRVGYSDTQETSPCGQVSFLPLSANTDYALTARVGGVTVWTQSGVVVEGNETVMIQLP